MMDYALPRASWLPTFELDETVTPSPVNPIGVKGVGETGTIPPGAAIANAVCDALAEFGVEIGEDDPRPPRVKCARGCGAEARAAAGDDEGGAVQLHVVLSL